MKNEDLPLSERKGGNSFLKVYTAFLGEEKPFRSVGIPELGGIRPVTGARPGFHESRRVDRQIVGLVIFMAGGKGNRSMLPHAAVLGLVEENSVQPRLERRAAFEASKPLKQPHPCILDHFFRNGTVRDMAHRQTDEACMIPFNQQGKRAFVSSPEPG